MLLLCFDLLAPVILKRLEWPENKLLVCFFTKRGFWETLGAIKGLNGRVSKLIETVKPYREAKKNRFLLPQRGFWQQENADRIGYL